MDSKEFTKALDILEERGIDKEYLFYGLFNFLKKKNYKIFFTMEKQIK